MIITHSNKFLSPKSKLVGAIYAGEIHAPYYVISSNYAQQSKKYWANAITAAYYKEAKEAAEKANKGDYVAENSFPDFIDTYAKQLFFKTKSGEYIIHTPLTSCALVDEFTVKAREIQKEYISTKSKKHMGYSNFRIQQSGVTLVNRGELAAKHGGIFFIKMTWGNLRDKGINKYDRLRTIKLEKNKKYLFFYGRLSDANVNSGFISAGLPSLTAIGGMIESIEVKLNYSESIPFAFGFKNNRISRGGKLGTDFKSGKVSTQLVMEEKKGELDFVIVLDVTNFNFKEISDQLIKIHRLAGGMIFDVKISETEINNNNEYLFFRNCKNIMKKALESGDVIDYIIRGNFHPIHCGFALLEKPTCRKGVRCHDKIIYKHAFSEPVFLPIRLTKNLYSKSFFKKEIYENCNVFS